MKDGVFHFCDSDFVSQVLINHKAYVGGETRYDVTIFRSYKSRMKLLDREFLWAPNLCNCPRLRPRKSYVIMGFMERHLDPGTMDDWGERVPRACCMTANLAATWFERPVDDRRRVVAMLSYRKAADSDELSFVKGDVFVVQNELEDGWLWVTCERTKESGLVPAPFVKDLDGDYEPVESLPYYHSCLSKEEAVEKLMMAGEGSFLVRQSENYPGDYSLFFLCEKDVRRFRIERRGNQFLVGGRFFDSLDGVIKRYMKEEIVEGHTLVNACIQDEKMKKFKPYYFVLNGTENILYFFENEKRSKPKGLIELNYTSIYPVHDSLFGRPNCFLLAAVYDNNSKTLSYINAESSEVIRRWVHFLKSSCVNTSGAPPGRGLRSLHSLSVTVISAHHVPNKLLQHPACTLSLNQHRVGRTQTCEGAEGSPFWGEEFQLDDIPPDVESITVSLYNVKRTREMFIGNVTIQLSALENQENNDEHYPMTTHLLQKGEVGTLKLRAHYQHQVLLPQAEYTSLKELTLHFHPTIKSCPVLQLNPALLDGATDSKANSEILLSLLNMFSEDIFRAVDYCPAQLRYICSCLQRKAKAKWPDDETVKTRVVSSFIFLRLLGPAIVNPKSFSLVSENPSETAMRTLKLVAKVLQMLANLVDAGPKCVHERPNTAVMSPGDIARELAVIHQLCVLHLEQGIVGRL
nr:hypothetical protein BaRGS_022997 [Batillaria attramentaria]